MCVCMCRSERGEIGSVPTAHRFNFNANKDVTGLSTDRAKVNTEMEGANTVTHAWLKGNPDDFSFPMIILLSVIVKRWGAGPL